MTCPNCHKEVDPGAAFCGNCGFKLDASVPQPNMGIVVGENVASPVTAAREANPHANSLATAAFVLGVLGCAGWLVPLIGVTLGVLAIIFGSLGLHSRRRILAIIGIVLAIPVIAVSIFFWVRTAEQVIKNGTNPLKGITTPSTSSTTQTVSTPCYTTKIPASMTVTQTAGSCTFSAINTGTGEQYEVKALQVTGLSTINLEQAAHADATNVVNQIPGASLSSQGSNTFSDSPAYTFTLHATDGSAGTIDYVYDATAQGNLVIVLHTQRNGKDYDLASIEKSWSWQ